MAKKAAQDSEAVDLYYKMCLIRKFEEKTGQAYGMGLIGGFCHLYIGQEAVACGVYAAINKDDQVVTSYRDHAHILLSGVDPKYVMAELFGKSTGCSKGKGGSMHLFDVQGGFYGGHGIVGAQVPIGAGIAFANAYRDEKRVCVTFFGDGAAHQGQVYESFNMAKLWNLPVIFIIENNEYAMGTSVKRSSSVQDLYHRGEGFGILSKKVDGMDVFEVKKAVQEACAYARSGNGPVLLEVKTYRYRGHSMSDPGNYRSKDEVKNIKDNMDPIDLLRKHIIKNNLMTEDEMLTAEKKAKDVVDEAIEFAKSSPEPELSELYTNVYAS